MTRRLFALAAIIVAAACSDATLPAEEPVQARAAGNATLAITNRSDEPVYYQVMDPTKFAIFYGCTPEHCPRIAAGATVRVPYAQIAYYEPGSAQAMVDWFTFEQAPDGTYRQKAYGSVIAEL
jgi:hypothetical protein